MNDGHERNHNLLYSIIAFAIACGLLYLSVFLSQHLRYNGSFILAFPIVLPLVFAMVSVGFSVAFIMGNQYPWFFRTGIMSLAVGITLSIFGIVTYKYGITSLLWAGSIGVGVLFILAAFVRLIIRGGLSAYRKFKS